MNTLKDLILTAAGGMMHTATLNTLTVLVAMVILVAIAVVMVYALSMIKGKPATRTVPVILDTQEK